MNVLDEGMIDYGLRPVCLGSLAQRVNSTCAVAPCFWPEMLVPALRNDSNQVLQPLGHCSASLRNNKRVVTTYCAVACDVQQAMIPHNDS